MTDGGTDKQRWTDRQRQTDGWPDRQRLHRDRQTETDGLTDIQTETDRQTRKTKKDHFYTLNAHFIFAKFWTVLHLSKRVVVV